MFDISNFSPVQINEYQAQYVIRKALEDIGDFYPEVSFDDAIQLASALHKIVLQFDPGY